MEPAPSLVGLLLAGRFRVIEHLGRGTMGDVYLAEHVLIERRYAIKVIKRQLQHDPAVNKRFRTEALAASRLNHPNVVDIFDFGQTEDGRFYLVMEHILGQDLQTLMERAAPGLLPLDRTLGILAQMACALTTAHDAGIVHRDIKPKNTMITTDATGGDLAKILDFGLARVAVEVGAAPAAQEGLVYGSPPYMAPEQAQGRPADHRADIYAFGVMAYQLLTGRLPVACTTPEELVQAASQAPPPFPHQVRPTNLDPLPLELERMIMRCLATEPTSRWPHIRYVREVLEETLLKLRHQEQRRADSIRIAPSALQRAIQAPSQIRKPSEESSTLADAVYDAEASFVEIEHDEWGHIYRLAVELAHRLDTHGHGSDQLPALIKDLSDRQVQARSLENEIATHRFHGREIGAEAHEAEARLRNAVIDLSLERNRLETEQATEASAMADLEYQIGELEKRLSEAEQVNQQTRDQKKRDLAKFERKLEAVKQAQIGLVLRLIGQLRASHPEKLGGEFAKLFRAIEALLPG